MSRLDRGDLYRILTDSTFTTSFAWIVIIPFIIFPMTTMITTCSSDDTRETIEIAKVQAQHGTRTEDPIATLKWMVSRGVHPLVARCAIWNSPRNQCAALMGNLKTEERSTITEMLANPFVEVVEAFEPGEVIFSPPPVDSQTYVQGVDFGDRSPVP